MFAHPVQSDLRWPHRIAVLLVCATFPLLWVGGLVTTYDAGMAVPDWPNTYGYNLFLYPWQTWVAGPWDIFIEHGHRLFAAAVGLLTILLAVSLWCVRAPLWLRGLGLAAVAGVIVQGLLGGLRVIVDERLLAMIHGCVGPVFFGLATSIAVFTSPRWRQANVVAAVPPTGKLARLAMITTALAYAQLVLGAQLRHLSQSAGPDTFRTLVVCHLFVAAALVVHVALLALRTRRDHRSDRALTRPAAALALLIGLQLALGAATWVTQYGWPSWMAGATFAAEYTVQAKGPLQSHVTTAHVAGGSLIVAVSLVLALRSLRLTLPIARPVDFQQAAIGAVA